MDGTFSVSGSPTITNNTVSGNANNVYLPGGKTITIGDGGLTGGTIGVSAKAITPGNAVKITDKNVTGAANRFTSDVAGYTIMEGIAPMEDAVYLFGGNIGTDVNIEVVYSSGGKVQFGTFEKARAASATEITLLKDITPTTASGFSWPITFKWTCTLDLNGYAIDRELKSGTNDGQIIVIESSGNLTIKDSSATQPDGTGGTGKITGGYDSGNGQNNGGGGIYIKSGSLTMESGSITGNQTDKFGGGVLIEGGNFSMSGGTISNNTASAGGGGVYVFTDCAFTMLDGTISRNSTTHYASAGGGVYVYTKGVFTMRDGTISENSTAIRGGGVYVINGTYTPEGGRVEDNSPDNVFQESP